MSAVQCGDGCEREQPGDEEAVGAGWRFLDLARRWRCPACAQDLAEANDRSRLPSRAAPAPPMAGVVSGRALARGDVIRHAPSGRLYRVDATGGKLRLPLGEWVEAVRYSPVPGASAHERLDVEYYRPKDDFGSFVEAT